MASENARTVETSSEKEGVSAAARFGNCGLISVLLETPSGFAIFGYDAFKLTEPEAWKHIWADFVDVPSAIFWLKESQDFENKGGAINDTTVSPELGAMILKHVVDGQTLAVENKDHKKVIQDILKIPCISGPEVKDLMWGLKIQMEGCLPLVSSAQTNEHCFPMSEGMKFLLDYHEFEVNPDMLVTKRFIEMAHIVYQCDRRVEEQENSLRLAATHIDEISGIDTSGWDLLKIVTALMIIRKPTDEIPAELFTEEQLEKFFTDAPQYKNKINKKACSEIHDVIYSARKIRLSAGKVLVRLVKQAKKAYEDEQARKASSDHESPARKKICRGFYSDMGDELTEWHSMLSAERKERQVSPTLAPVDALKRYTQISGHPLNLTRIPGILSMDIHPSKAIVATGGIDTNAVLFDCLSSQILCTLTGHSKDITSLKFLNQNGLFITGSADKTVRIWQESKDENYSCIRTLKDHTAEVEAVTVHASQKYFVTASRDNSWRLYDVPTGSCLAQVGESSGQQGYTSAAFHPDGLILGTGTTDGVVKIWDVKTQTAASDGVKIWDLRMHRESISPLCLSTYSHKSINAVEFDFSGSYLAIGGSDVSVYEVSRDVIDWNAIIKTLTDPSGTGEITCMKFGADASYIAVGSMDQNLRIFGARKEPASYRGQKHVSLVSQCTFGGSSLTGSVHAGPFICSLVA